MRVGFEVITGFGSPNFMQYGLTLLILQLKSTPLRRLKDPHLPRMDRLAPLNLSENMLGEVAYPARLNHPVLLRCMKNGLRPWT
jgi:hypothetical protein